jgi:hypothetical protein
MESKMTMPAGRYFIGDLCYVLPAEWDEVCAIVLKEDDILDGEFNLNDGRRFASYTTMYGDGWYGKIVVDSGGIGCIRIDDIRSDITEQQLCEKGMIVDFPSSFQTSGSPVDGIIKFGDITIDTTK